MQQKKNVLQSIFSLCHCPACNKPYFYTLHLTQLSLSSAKQVLLNTKGFEDIYQLV